MQRPLTGGGTNVYTIKNAVFGSFVGRASYEDHDAPYQAISGVRFDPEAHTRFNVYYTHDDRIVFFIDDMPVVTSEYRLLAVDDRSVEPDEFTVNFVSECNFRVLYTINLAENPELVWTLNSNSEPLNKVVLSYQDKDNPRQLWDLEYQLW